jgi:hypothetical protein
MRAASAINAFVFSSGWNGLSFSAGLPRPAVGFPLPVDSYHDQEIPSVRGKLAERIEREPLNLVLTIIFFGAIVHTFLAGQFRKIAHNYQQSYDAIDQQSFGTRQGNHCFVVVGDSDARPIARFLHHGAGCYDDLRTSAASPFL